MTLKSASIKVHPSNIIYAGLIKSHVPSIIRNMDFRTRTEPNWHMFFLPSQKKLILMNEMMWGNTSYTREKVLGTTDCGCRWRHIKPQRQEGRGKLFWRLFWCLVVTYLPTPQNSCTVWEAMELKPTYFVPYRKANKRCGLYEWKHEDLRQESRISVTLKKMKKWECCRISCHERICIELLQEKITIQDDCGFWRCLA